jgi:hypothetical protein
MSDNLLSSECEKSAAYLDDVVGEKEHKSKN